MQGKFATTWQPFHRDAQQVTDRLTIKDLRNDALSACELPIQGRACCLQGRFKTLHHRMY